ncbi:DNA methyltransferase [Trueperella sp. LYQ143]|uniref:DNA methyltransferase n=1 Tax=Trueperella sp. LYQ143 TaxID=3391059 RepID=UPI003983B18C
MAIGVPSSVSSSLSYELIYEGKRAEADVINDAVSLDYRTIFETDAEAANTLYFGDNLSVLGDLLNNPEVRGKVELIYIDPPYATNSNFHNRKQEFAYSDTLFGAGFVEFLRVRLILMRELLSPTGSIYVHLDNKMVFEAKLIMDEVFGRHNFRSMITRKKSNPKNYSSKQFGNISDYILFYSRSKQMTFNVQHTPWTEATALKEYQYVEEGTGRRYKKVPIHAPGTRNGATGGEWKGMLPPPGKHWQYTPDKLDEFDRRGEIYWSPTGNPRRKVYLDERPGIAVQDIWLDFKDAHNQNIRITGYPTEKNLDLLKLIISASSNPGDLVLDAFAGSGTTLEAASRLGRRWIGVDNSELAIQTIRERFENGTRPMGDFRSFSEGQDNQMQQLDLDFGNGSEGSFPYRILQF